MYLHNVLPYILWAILAVIIIIGIWITVQYLLPVGIYAQQNKTPPAITPVPVPTPTPTEPNPNFQYLPQKAAVQVYSPEVGIPQNAQPLQVVPQVVPAPAAQPESGIFGISGLETAALVAAIGTFVRNELKNKTLTGIVKKIAGTQVQQIEAQEEHLGLTFEQMPDKGNEITNKPNIKQDHIKEIKREALETAEKA